MKRKEHPESYDMQQDNKKVKLEDNGLEGALGVPQGEDPNYNPGYPDSYVNADPHNQQPFEYFQSDPNAFPQLGYPNQFPAYAPQGMGDNQGADADDGTQQYNPLYNINPTPGYQYLAYIKNEDKCEPVIIYYDQDRQPHMIPAPQYQEHIQAMSQQMQFQDSFEPQDGSSKKKSSSGSDNQEKASVAELAKRVGLLKHEHKEWRFRDQKRTLLLKLRAPHQQYIENSSLDEILLRRLPHKITAGEFARRLWLLVFHTVVAEGNPPKFWDRVTDREYLENHLDEEFKNLRNVQFATEVYNEIAKHDCSIQEAVNSVAFRNPRPMAQSYERHDYPQQQEGALDSGIDPAHFANAE